MFEEPMQQDTLTGLVRAAQIAHHNAAHEKQKPLRDELAQIEAQLLKADTAVQPELRRLERAIAEAQSAANRACDALQKARDDHNRRCSTISNRKGDILKILAKTVNQEKSENMNWSVPDWHIGKTARFAS